MHSSEWKQLLMLPSIIFIQVGFYWQDPVADSNVIFSHDQIH